jgi:hypothetical protein
MMLLSHCKKRISSGPLAEPQSQDPGIKGDGTVQIAHFQMHVAEAQGHWLYTRHCSPPIRRRDFSGHISMAAHGGSQPVTIAGSLSVIGIRKLQKFH